MSFRHNSIYNVCISLEIQLIFKTLPTGKVEKNNNKHAIAIPCHFTPQIRKVAFFQINGIITNDKEQLG